MLKNEFAQFVESSNILAEIYNFLISFRIQILSAEMYTNQCANLTHT